MPINGPPTVPNMDKLTWRIPPRYCAEIAMTFFNRCSTYSREKFQVYERVLPRKATPTQINPYKKAVIFDGKVDSVSFNGFPLMYVYNGLKMK